MIYLVQKVRIPIITVTIVVSNDVKNSSHVKISAKDESIGINFEHERVSCLIEIVNLLASK